MVIWTLFNNLIGSSADWSYEHSGAIENVCFINDFFYQNIKNESIVLQYDMFKFTYHSVLRKNQEKPKKLVPSKMNQ